MSDDGSVLAVGATYNDGIGSDSMHVRVYENKNGSWEQIGQDLDGENAHDWSGHSVAQDNEIPCRNEIDRAGLGQDSIALVMWSVAILALTPLD